MAVMLIGSGMMENMSIVRSIPLITMNSKLQFTTGSRLGLKGSFNSRCIPRDGRKNSKKDFEKVI